MVSCKLVCDIRAHLVLLGFLIRIYSVFFTDRVTQLPKNQQIRYLISLLPGMF